MLILLVDSLEKYLHDALRQMNIPIGDAKLVTTEKSEEPVGTGIKSTLKPFSGYKRKWEPKNL